MKKLSTVLLLLICFIPVVHLTAEKIKLGDVKNIILAIEKKLKEIKKDTAKADLCKKEIKKIEESIVKSRGFLQKKKLKKAYYTMKIAEKYFEKMIAIEALHKIQTKYNKTKIELTNKKKSKNE